MTKAVKNFEAVFDQLRELMQPYENSLVLKADEPDKYYLDTPFKRSDGYTFAFGGVQIKKNYVSYHLIPVYSHPELLEGMSEKLKKRMQGKSCFNFTKLEEDILTELKTLTQKGFEVFKQTDYSVYER